jgi:putative solute:sodium symporter small subunit
MPGPRSIDVHDPRIRSAIDSYWRQNLRIMGVLLAIWAVVGLGCGVLFADSLNRFHLGGFPLGFWFAQQGSIVVFVLLILVYCVLLNRLDDRHHREIDRIQSETVANG